MKKSRLASTIALAAGITASSAFAQEHRQQYLTATNASGCTSDNHEVTIFYDIGASTIGKANLTHLFTEHARNTRKNIDSDLSSFLKTQTYQQAILDPYINLDTNGNPQGGLVNFLESNLPAHFAQTAQNFINDLPENVQMGPFGYRITGIDHTHTPSATCINGQQTLTPQS